MKNTSAHMDGYPRSSRSFLGRIIHRLWVWIRRYLVFIGFLTTLVSFLIFWRINSEDPYNLRERDDIEPSDHVFLELKVKGSLSERSSPSNSYELIASQIFGSRPRIDALELRSTLKKAAKDDQVKGLFLSFEPIQGTFAAVDEIRSILLEFKQSGKPIHAFLNGQGDTKTYFLASVADKVSISPLGVIFLAEPLFSFYYLAKALKDFGVNIQLIRAGEYKAALEPLVRDSPSREALTMYQSIENDLTAYLSTSISESRKIVNSSEVLDWFSVSLFNAQDALKNRLVDEVRYNDPKEILENALKEKEGSQFNLKCQDYFNYQERSSSVFSLVRNERKQEKCIAVIQAMGELTSSRSTREESINYEGLSKQLKWARESEEIVAVVLRISSPGGDAVVGDLLWEEVNKLKKTKPVVASFGGVAASGGYYIATPAHKIVAQNTTITGSIGVFSMNFSIPESYEKYGVSSYIVTRSEREQLLNIGKKPSQKDREILERYTNEVYERFKTVVSKGRNLSMTEVEKIAGGRVWTGRQAKEIGLVDQLGTMMDAIKLAEELVGHEGKSLPLLYRYANSIDLISYIGNLPHAKFFERLTRLNPDISLNTFGYGYIAELLNESAHPKPQALWLGSPL